MPITDAERASLTWLSGWEDSWSRRSLSVTGQTRGRLAHQVEGWQLA